MSDDKCIANYLRLSLEDDDFMDESNSITNQRIALGQYISGSREFDGMEVVEFKDDGYSGTNFDRPGFQEMMSMARKGKIGIIIVKDLSRFGRNHIETDTYLEQIFPFLGIRFIAINDNVDSRNFESGLPGMDVGFRNIINEHHSVETSQKVKCSFRQRMKEGRYMGARAPYGYLKPPENVTSLAVDPQTAPVVKKIFELYTSGLNITQVARWLNEQEIMCPGQYKKEVLKTGVKKTTNNWLWYPSTVRLILTTETYVGKTISGRWQVSSVGSNRHVRTSEDEWIVVEGTHEAIISRQLYDAAQEKLAKYARKKKQTHNNEYPLKGMLFCGGCGQKLIHVTRCRPHVKCPRKFNVPQPGCLEENMYDEDLNGIVLRAVGLFASIADDAAPVLEERKEQLRFRVNEAGKKIRRGRELLKRLEHEKTELYMQYMLEEITKKEYLRMMEKNAVQIQNTESEIAEQEILQNKTAEQLSALPDTGRECLSELVSGVDSLTREIALNFIRKIIISSDKCIEIEWNFRDELVEYVEKQQKETDRKTTRYVLR